MTELSTVDIEIEGKPIEIEVTNLNPIANFIYGQSYPDRLADVIEDEEHQPTMEEAADLCLWMVKTYTKLPDSLVDQLPAEAVSSLAIEIADVLHEEYDD
jgi:hypothetical protein